MRHFLLSLFLLSTTSVLLSQKKPLQALDVFQLEYASDPQISPDGRMVVYKRNGFDIMKDKAKGSLWILNTDGSDHHKLTASETNESAPRWSPDGSRIAFSRSTGEGSEIYMYWMQHGTMARVSQLENSPSSLAWSPDGKWLAFSMKVDAKPPVIVKAPKKPKGAKWADTPRITDRLKHEADGAGYIKPGFRHIFVIPAEGGSPRQITSGDWNHSGKLSWSPDGKELYFSANRVEDWEYRFRNSEVYKVNVVTGEIKGLTDRNGPDLYPIVSPNGKKVAYLGSEDKIQAYQLRKLWLMDIDGNNVRSISDELDRSISNPVWDAEGKGLYVTYDDRGNTKIAHISLSGNVTKLADNLGGTSLGRPYAGGSFSVNAKGDFVYTMSTPAHPAELAYFNRKQKNPRKITDLNGDLLPFRELGEVEEVWYRSSVDGRDIQGWIVKPPGYDSGKKYPLLIENHGGPILNYGDRFTAEIQLYAAAGYLVFYPNPRGSTSYGEAFGNLLYNNYPGEDYNDVMDGVDHLLKKGLIDEDHLYVTGGSAGGIMTAWIIGKTNRFKAAVVAKPVMNWISKTLVTDNYYGYANSRYPGQPWENFEGYWKFSPISLVGNVETPTMVMVGMNDLRTPPSEAKQLYHALKLRKIETVLVEIPGASHGIARRPSQLITKVAHTLAWFEKYRDPEE